MTSTERAVRKANGQRLLRDFARAAEVVALVRFGQLDGPASDTLLAWAAIERSRTRYACLMTAFGQ